MNVVESCDTKSEHKDDGVVRAANPAAVLTRPSSTPPTQQNIKMVMEAFLNLIKLPKVSDEQNRFLIGEITDELKRQYYIQR